MLVPLKFYFPISTLETESQFILGAAHDAAHSTLINERLDDGLLDEADGLWSQLFATDDGGTVPPVAQPVTGSSAAQKGAAGTVGVYTALQKEKLAIYNPLEVKARKNAKTAFAGQTVKLHDEFRIASTAGEAIRDIVADGRLILAALRNTANAAVLKTKAGYIKKDADAFAVALNELSESETNQEGAKSDALGATDLRNTKLNRLFDLTILIQSAGFNEWPDRATQSAFRRGHFPPKHVEKPTGDENPATQPPAAPQSPSQPQTPPSA